LCWRSCTWERRTRCRRRAVDLGGWLWRWNSGRRSNISGRHHRVAARRLEQRRPRLVVLLPPRPRLVVLRRSGRRCLRVIGGRWWWCFSVWGRQSAGWGKCATRCWCDGCFWRCCFFWWDVPWYSSCFRCVRYFNFRQSVLSNWSWVVESKRVQSLNSSFIFVRH